MVSCELVSADAGNLGKDIVGRAQDPYYLLTLPAVGQAQDRYKATRHHPPKSHETEVGFGRRDERQSEEGFFFCGA